MTDELKTTSPGSLPGAPREEWQPIDAAPRDGTYVLLYAPESIQERNAGRPFYCVSRWIVETREYWERTSERRQELKTEDASHWENWELPTHWMPLPDPPAETNHD